MNIDFHAHILPRCDHGSSNLDISLRQLEFAQKAGVDLICATPHFYPQKENLDCFLERREKCWKELRSHLNRNFPQVLLGAEVLICDGLERMEGLERLCLEGSNMLLLEMPFGSWSSRNFKTVQAITEIENMQVVLAHIDRYNWQEVSVLMKSGVYAQVNVNSLCGWHIPRSLKQLLADGDIFALGSDIHGTEVGYKYWLRCRKKLGNSWDQLMARLCTQIMPL